MNVHVSSRIQSDWPAFYFKGKPFIFNNLKWIRAEFTILRRTYMYNFEKNIMVGYHAYEIYKRQGEFPL